MLKHQPYALFRDDKRNESLLFSQPRELVIAHTADEVLPALERLEQAHRDGFWLAGFFSYEAGFVFEAKLRPLIIDNRQTPLLAMGIFTAPGRAAAPATADISTPENETFLSKPQVTWNFAAYRKRFERLHWHIRQGDCYQANLTMPITARWSGTPVGCFSSLIARQPVHYGALIDFGGPTILSRSPELFFEVDADRWIETHPMKGTAGRGATQSEDEAIIAAMLADEKTLAENRMIVDLLRNDISVISETGTLCVPKLFAIETYPTVHQMVSHVRARLRPDIGLAKIMAALFPCGSITGAPKMWAMNILHSLETGPRDAYCGAIGWCNPDGPMRFSVAIRTLTLFNDGNAVFNVGGGIVFDSNVEAEYEECLLKARFALSGQEILR